MERYVPPAREVTFAAWREATQQYQAEVLRLTIETLRRLKFRPTGGFCLSSLVDAAPLVSTSLLDHRRRPKLAFDAVADACRPVVVVAEQPPASIGPGERCSLDVHVVSDLRTPLADVRCTATVSGGGLHQQWTWEGDVPADSCVRVGEVRFIAPPAGGDVVLDLVLELAPSSSDAASAQVVTNRYRTTVAR
jgi:beta-mannosidase